MKNLIIISLLILGNIFTASSQSCFPDGILFSNQSEIDNFSIDYPNCTEIEGDMIIQGVSITNLNGLSTIESVGGSLIIKHNVSLNNIDGLSSITQIGNELVIDTNDVIQNIQGLQNVINIGSNISISHNHLLNNLGGISGILNINGDLKIFDNDDLLSLSGFENLSSINGSLIISQNHDLQDLSSLSNLLTIDSNLVVSFNHELSSLSGLDNIDATLIDNLSIFGNYSLSTCNISSVCNYLSNPPGSINIYGNYIGCYDPIDLANSCGISLSCLPFGNYYFFGQDDVDNFPIDYPDCNNLNGNVEISGFIDDLDGLTGINSIEGDLELSQINSNSILYGLNNLSYIGGSLTLNYLYSITNLTGLNNLDSIGNNFEISRNYDLTSLSGLESLTYVGGDLYLFDNMDLITLTGINNLSYLGNNLRITFNNSLLGIDAFDNLDIINGNLDIQSNYYLTNITSLGNIDTIKGRLSIFANTLLPNLEGLDSLIYVGGDLEIQSSDDLVDLLNLSNLRSIGGKLSIMTNSHLNSLAGLDSIDPGSISDLYIEFNALTECDVLSICNYLANPNGETIIENNHQGCESEEEVLEKCFTKVSTETIGNWFVYPNPSKNEISISDIDPTLVQRIIIFNSIGGIVLDTKSTSGRIDISHLSAGIYLIKLGTTKGVVYKRFIVQK